MLARVDGEPAAAAKATTFDGFTYLSSIGTRAAFRGRGLAGLATRHAIALAGGADRGVAYLGVFSGNEPALRVYERPRVRVARRVAGPAARMTRWARLTWQAADPAALAPDLAARLGVAAAERGGLAPGARLLRLGIGCSRSGRGSASRRRTTRCPAGGCCWSPSRTARTPGSAAADDDGPRRRPLRLAGLGWATVELDRAEDELGMWLGPTAAANPDAPATPADPLLGARPGSAPAAGCRALDGAPRAGDRGPRSPRRSRATARVPSRSTCDPPRAWTRGWRPPARRGVTASARRIGPFGRAVLVLGGPVAGPHLVIVDTSRAPGVADAAAGTIAP